MHSIILEGVSAYGGIGGDILVLIDILIEHIQIFSIGVFRVTEELSCQDEPLFGLSCRAKTLRAMSNNH